MKRFLLIIFLLISHFADAQSVSGKVLDSATGKPLSYAIISYSFQKNITYSDANGIFFLQKDSLLIGDSIHIQFLGYRKMLVSATEFKNGALFNMVQEEKLLEPVIILTCKKTKLYDINKRVGRIKHYIGPGPETKFVVLAKYNNTSGKDGYISSVKIYLDQNAIQAKVPVRLRWFEWDLLHQQPGIELTDTNVIVYPYKDGWNEFALPLYTIFAAKDYIVFGLEFIYPPGYQQQYALLKTDREKLEWLANMEHRWSLGMEYLEDISDAGFYSINNGIFNRYNRREERYYIRPAITFTITACAER